MKRCICLLILPLVIGMTWFVAAGNAAGADQEAPVWVETVGEAAGSEFDPPREVMERARNEAKRRALEEAVGSFVRSHALVSNGQLAEEFTFARVRGVIDKVRIVSEERDKSDPNLCRVRIRALVRPVYPRDGEGISVKLDLTRTSLREGDEVRIQYQTNADSYVYIFSIAADNSVTLLFPNALNRDNFVKAERGQLFPPDSSPVKIRAIPLPDMKGKVSSEKVKIIAARRREILLERGFTEGMFQVYDARSTGLVSDLARKLHQLDPADWGEAVAVYTIEPDTRGTSPQP